MERLNPVSTPTILKAEVIVVLRDLNDLVGNLRNPGTLFHPAQIAMLEVWFHEEHITTFPSFEMAARVLNNLYWYKNFLVKRAE